MTSLTNGPRPIPFCDWLTVSVPVDDFGALSVELESLLLRLGAFRGPYRYYFAGDGGVVRIRSNGQVRVVSLSGRALETIRMWGAWHDVLGLIAGHPHRVTRLDVAADTGEHGCEVVPKIERQGYAGEVRLSRKAVPADRVQRFQSIGPCGELTGTVYLGRRGAAEVLARVYDKRAEVYAKTGYDSGAAHTRYELELHCEGLTLRDAAEPEALFWHYGGGRLMGLETPADVSAWVGHAEGFRIEPRPSKTAYAALAERVGSSAEVDAWVQLADELGHAGRTLLLSVLRKRLGLASSWEPPRLLTWPHGAVPALSVGLGLQRGQAGPSGSSARSWCCCTN